MKTAEAAQEFLGCRRFAVTGVSREPANHGSNVVYKRLRESGYDVVPVNPNAETVEGDHCYRSLNEVPGEIDVVVIGTRPERAVETVQECIDRGVTRVWMHRASAPQRLPRGHVTGPGERDHRDRRRLPLPVHADRRLGPPVRASGVHGDREGAAHHLRVAEHGRRQPQCESVAS